MTQTLKNNKVRTSLRLDPLRTRNKGLGLSDSKFNMNWFKFVNIVDASKFSGINIPEVQQLIEQIRDLSRRANIKTAPPFIKPYVLDIVQFSEQPQVLRQKSIPLPHDFIKTNEFQFFALILLLTLMLSEFSVGSPGIGLSAIQVGVPWQMFWAYIDKLNTWELVINPYYEAFDATYVTEKEGCLSLTGIEVPVPRYKGIKTKYINKFGSRNKIILKNLDARVFQHEFDHLQGKLIVDYKR